MPHANHIDDLDLLALADGFLDDDPARKAEVEAAIARNPQATAERPPEHFGLPPS